MNTIDFQDKFENIKKYVKYLIIIIPIIIAIVLLRSCGNTNYSKIEKELEDRALEYVKQNNISVSNEKYIEITKLKEIEGTELCSRASGVIITNKSGKFDAQAYLNCEDYESEVVDNKQKYIALNGEAIIKLNVGEVFNDPLYSLKKEAEVRVDGVVGTQPGIYTIYYSAYVSGKLKETVMRKVIVSEADKTINVSGINDKDNPTITLIGDKNIVLLLGDTYKEPGYLAVDYKDGKITRQVKVIGSVNTSVAGLYSITYSVTNSRGKNTLAVRSVTVVRKKANLDIKLSLSDTSLSQTTKILIDISGEGYNYTKLPDGSTNVMPTITYEVRRNDKYTIRVYDNYNNEFVKEIDVTNIDDVPPNGNCHAVVSSNKTQITVSAADNKGIAGYSYDINGSTTEFISQNNYEAFVKGASVKVNIKDISENVTTLSCTIEEKNIISGGLCRNTNANVDVKTCFGENTIRTAIPLEEYLVGVLYAEEDPDINDSMEYIKAFVIFARTYTLRRGNYNATTGKMSLKTCSSDQNWCDYDQGCYRYQTDEMFDQCIQYSIDRKYYSSDKNSPYYTADVCANRVTTFPGTNSVSNKMYYVNNPAWPSNMASSVMSSSNTSRWKSALTGKKREFLINAVAETAGLVIKTPDGKLASVGYYVCDEYSNSTIMCPNKAEELGNRGYSAEEIIKAYTTKYPEIIIECL